MLLQGGPVARDDRKQPSIVITGASTGIGRACAERFDRIGWRVFAGVRRDVDAQALRESS